MSQAHARTIASVPDQIGHAQPLRPRGTWWGWLGLHGGAGVTTLDRAVPGGHVLSLGDHDIWPALPVVAVARTHAAGLQPARDFAAMVADTPGWTVLGLVVVADAPGRLPRELERLLQLVSGGYPKVWRCPWVEAWRRGDPATPRNLPNAYVSLLRDLMTSTDMGAALETAQPDHDNSEVDTQ